MIKKRCGHHQHDRRQQLDEALWKKHCACVYTLLQPCYFNVLNNRYREIGFGRFRAIIISVRWNRGCRIIMIFIQKTIILYECTVPVHRNRVVPNCWPSLWQLIFSKHTMFLRNSNMNLMVKKIIQHIASRISSLHRHNIKNADHTLGTERTIK